jgi:autotransporter-associated beta strand protein
MKNRNKLTLALCAGALAAGSSLAADRTWTGAAGTTVINTANNWSGSAAPTAATDIAIWDGTVMTNQAFVWNAGFGPGSGNAGAPSFRVGAGYINPLILMNSGAGGNLSLSNITIAAGAGPFTLGSNGVTSTTVFRAASNTFRNDSTNPATIAQNVVFNNGGGASRTVYFAGSGDWDVNSPFNGAGAGLMAMRVDGTGSNTLTLNAGVTLNSSGHTIANGTMRLTHGDALAIAGTQTLTIDGGSGIKRLAMSNSISLNPAVANINIAGRDVVGAATDAAIVNLAGDNSINGRVVFNAVGGTNLSIYNQAGTLTFNGNASLSAFTAANVTGNRYIHFGGAGTSIVGGIIANGSATLGLVLGGGTLVLNNANTHTGNTIINAGVLTLGYSEALAYSTVVVNGGVLDVNGIACSPNIGGLSGTGTVDTLSGGTPVLSVGANNTGSAFAGTIVNSSGSLSLQKIGTNTCSLSGASSFSGGVTVAAGTLLVDNLTGSGTGSGNVTVNWGSVLGGIGRISGSVDWQSGSLAQFTLTPSASVSGSNATPMTVSGSLILNDNAVVVHIPGTTPLGVGTYKLMSYLSSGTTGTFNATPSFTGAGTMLGTASTISTSGGTVTLTVIFTGVVSTWIHDGNGNWSTGADWSSSPYYPHVSGDSATLGVGSAFTSVTLDTDAIVGTLSFTNTSSFLIANSGKTLTFGSPSVSAVVSVQAGSSNAIATPVALDSNLSIAAAPGTALTLSGVINNGAEPRSMSVSGAGTVVLSGNNAYGTSAGVVGTTVGGGGVLGLGHNNALGVGDLSVGSSSTIRADAALTVPNNIIAQGGATATMDNNGNNVTLSGVISGPGSFSKNSAGTLTLGSANSYNGNTAINAGTVKLGVTGAIPGGSSFGSVTVNTNAVLDLNGTDQTLNGLNGAGTVLSSVGGAVTLTLGSDGAWGTFTGNILNGSGVVSLVKDGAGTQTLAGTNTYSGLTTINTGTLQIGNGGTSGTLGSGAVSDAGILSFNLTGTNHVANVISGAGEVVLANTNLHLFLDGANTAFTGPVRINGGHLWVNNPQSLGTGPKTVIVTGGGVSALTTLHLLGNVTLDSTISYEMSYFGGALVNESGTNTVQGDIGMPYGGGAANINVKGGLLNLAGTISAISPGRTLQLGGVGNGVLSGVAADSGAGGAIGAVQKLDAGTWTIEGMSTSAAGATVMGGTLLVNGQWSGAVTVNTNTILGGTGTLGSTVNWQPGSSALFTLTPSGGANTTPFTVAGAATLNNNTVTVNIPGSTPLPVGSYTLMTYNSTGSSGSFAMTPVITGAGIPAKTVASVVTGNGVVLLVVSPSDTWVFDGNGNWTTGANWDSNPHVPGNAGDFATFGVASSLVTVNLDANETVGGINFTNSNSFVVTNQANTLTLNNNGSGAVINVTAGNANVIASPVSLVDDTTVSVAGGRALALRGNITGTGGLSKTGNGTLALTASNDFIGTVSVSAGVLALGSTNALSTSTLVLRGGNLDSVLPGLVNLNNNAQIWGASFGFMGSQDLNLGTGDVGLSGNITLSVSNKTLTVAGPITGAYGLTVQGTGILELDGTNSFTGLTFTGGRIALGSDDALGTAATLQFSPASTNGVTIASKDASRRTITNNISVNNDLGQYIIDGTGELEIKGNMVTGNGQKRFVVNNTTYFSGLTTDNGAPYAPIVKQGTGTLVISGANAFTKQFNLESGTLALGSATALGVGTLAIYGGSLDSTVADLALANNNPQTWNGSFGFAGSQNLNLGVGGVVMTTNVTVTVAGKTLTVGGPIAGSSFSLTKAGAGTLVLNGSNTNGNTTVNGGTLEIAQATLQTNATVSIASGALFKLNFGTVNQIAALVLNGVSQPNGVYNSTTSPGFIAGIGSLKVVSLAPSTPAIITNSVSGSQMTLSWPPGQGWRLQAQTNSLATGISNNWVYVTDGSVSSTNLTINANNPTVFYRLVWP